MKWMDKRSVKDVTVGSRIDVRDTESIWCIGIVKDIIKNKNHKETLLIHYAGWDNIYDEYICINSHRLAPLGYFTERRGTLIRHTAVCDWHGRWQSRDELHRVGK